MFIQRTALTGLFFSLLFFLTSAQEKLIVSIDMERMREHLTYLSSDELQGRRLGTEVEGLKLAAEYLKDYAEEIGLKPAVPGYFQEFELVNYSPGLDSELEVCNENGRPLYRTGGIVRIDGGHNDTSLNSMPVVFAGFGEQVGDADLSGKVVVISQSDAEHFGIKRNTAWNNRAEYSKARSFFDRKPEAVIVISGLNDQHGKVVRDMKAYFSRPRYRLPESEMRKRIPIIVALPELADKLLGGKNKYQKYLAEVAAENRTGIFEPTNRRINLSLKVEKGTANVKNVVALVEGADPKLKDECVVFMSHYDHLGIDESGEVFNGADDNGSGTVTIMEVAKAFASMKNKPSRSILFLWVTCEEIGMFGSSYYTDNPVFPMEKTVTCFNLDMVGRVYEPRDSVWKDSPKQVKDFNGLFTLTNEVWPELAVLCNKECDKLDIVPDTTLPQTFLRMSDHYSFHKKGVPILNLATGYHADYHKVGDEVEKINFEKMKRIAELCVMLGLEVANRENIPSHPSDL